MCFPAAGMIFGLAGAVVQGIGAAQGAQAQAQSYAMQARMHERQAALERESGAYAAARVTEQGKKIIGGQVAGYAASGINPSTGTAKETIIQTGETAALDVAAVRYGSRIAQENSLNQARVNRFNSASANAAVPFAFLAPVIGAFTRVGTSFSGSFA